MRVTTQMLSVSGPIPSPEMLKRYEHEQQERILRMAEATTTDESARRDQLQTAQIRLARNAQWITPALMLVSFAAALFCFAALRNTIAGALFLAFPVARLLGTFVTSFRLRGSDNRAPDNPDD